MHALQRYLWEWQASLACIEIEDLNAFQQKKEKILQDMMNHNIDYILSDTEALIDGSLEGLHRVTDIVQSLKMFARINEGENSEVNSHDGLDATLKVLKNELKYKTRVVKEYGELPKIRGNLLQLNQVFMNLLINALQAIECDGVIIVHTSCQAEHIIIAITDNGTRIRPETFTKLYDLFFTTKPLGVGTGLGLSISYGIVKKHSGEITLESEWRKERLLK